MKDMQLELFCEGTEDAAAFLCVYHRRIKGESLIRGEPGRMKAKWRATESEWEGELWVAPHASLSPARRSAGFAGAALLSKSTAVQKRAKHPNTEQTLGARAGETDETVEEKRSGKWGTRTLVTHINISRRVQGKSSERQRERRKTEKVLMAEVWRFTLPGPERDPLHPSGFLLHPCPFSVSILWPYPLLLHPLSHIPSLAHHSHSQTRRRGERCLYRISARLRLLFHPAAFSRSAEEILMENPSPARHQRQDAKQEKTCGGMNSTSYNKNWGVLDPFRVLIDFLCHLFSKGRIKRGSRSGQMKTGRA